MVSFKLSGVVPPVFTPLNDDQTINFEVIPGYAQFLAKAGIKGVLVGGTTGENMTRTVADRKRVIDAWVAAGKATGLHIMVQVGGAPLMDVVELARYSASAGADSLLTLPELYFKPTTVAELVDYVGLVAAAAPTLPVLYYHIPRMNGVPVNMPAFVTAATAQIPNFRGLKFTSNDLAEAKETLKRLTGDQQIFLGADSLQAPAALLGIKSAIGTFYNIAPQLPLQIYQAMDTGDVATARALQEKLSLAVEAISVEGSWVPVMKAAMEMVTGLKMGPPSLPLRPISAEARKRIQETLTKQGFCAK